MAQGEREARDKIDFNTMLPNMYLLYLGCQVLVCMYDRSYMERFWPQLEAWLSFRRASSDGLGDTPPQQLRCTVTSVCEEADMFTDDLRKRWACSSVADAQVYLAKNWVAVYDPADKKLQLQKLGHLNYMVRHILSAEDASAPSPPPPVTNTAGQGTSASGASSRSDDRGIQDVKMFLAERCEMREADSQHYAKLLVDLGFDTAKRLQLLLKQWPTELKMKPGRLEASSHYINSPRDHNVKTCRDYIGPPGELPN